jgi:hypothetical protein
MKYLILLAVFATAISFTSCSKDSTPTSTNSGYNIVANSTYKNHSWSDWSNMWWSWALAMPDGANAVQGTAPMETNQSGDVWFLSGNLKGGTETRSVTIPQGKSVFVALLNFYADTTGGYPPADSLMILANQLWTGSNATVSLFEIDGKSVDNIAANYYAPVTSFTNQNIPQKNVIGDMTYGKDKITSYAASCGYYMMIDGLSMGTHTIHFKASNLAPLNIEMTYNITVK